jgi:hypothetical protein
VCRFLHLPKALQEFDEVWFLLEYNEKCMHLGAIKGEVVPVCNCTYHAMMTCPILN